MSCKSLSGSFSLDVQELSRPCNVCSIIVRWFTSIKDIKDQLKQKFNVAPSRMSLFHISSPKSLSNQITLHDLGIEQSGHILRVAINVTSATLFQLLPSKDIEIDYNSRQMLSYVRQGFERSQIPAKTDMLDCTGGVYFLKASSGEKVAVFKPNDEEQGMPNNPKGHAGSGEEGLRPNFKPGQGYIRETAAYLFDYQNFCQVPPTTIVHCEHSSFHYPLIQGKTRQMFPKVGSLQKFVHAGDTFEDISPSLIGTLELQKIAILDIRLLNCDRNSSNILAIRKAVPNTFHTGVRCRRDSRSSSMGSHPDDSCPHYSEDAEFNPFLDEEAPVGCGGSSEKQPDLFELIPIDHGYCIPSRLKIDELDWIWFYCAQIAKEVDPEIRRYVNSLDIDEMVDRLETQLKIPEYSCFLLRLSHHLLVEGIAAGLTLFDIASMIARTEEEKPSLLENVIKVSEENAHRTVEMRSNRLNSRGLASDHKSPVRFLDERNSLTPVGGGRLQRARGMSSSCSAESKLGEGRGMSRMVQSAMNLEEMGRDQLSDLQTAHSPRSGRSKAPKLMLSMAHTGSLLHSSSPYLSSENIEKLCNSPHLPKFPSSNSFMQEYTSASSSPAHDEFYLAELSPVDPTAKKMQNCGVTLGLNGSLLRPDGGRLRTLQSVDSPIREMTESPPLHSQHHSRKPSSSMTGSYLHTGLLLDSQPAVCGGDDLHYQRSEPIMIALRDCSMECADNTSCEASSKEGSGSPKSFGDIYFGCSSGSLVPSAEQKLGDCTTGAFAPSNTPCTDSNMHCNNIPFSGVSSSVQVGVVERPFPPRSDEHRESVMSKSSKDSNNSSKKQKNQNSRSRAASEGAETQVADESSSSNTTSSEESGGEAASNERSSAATLLARDASISSLSSIRSAGNLHRTASFNAFESPAIYEDRSDRQLTRLHREKRKKVERSADYQDLRLKFALEAISSAVTKEAKRKAQLSGLRGGRR